MNLMKTVFKCISRISILLFAVWYVGGKVTDWSLFQNVDISSMLVVIFLFTSMKYYQMDSRDKEETITQLKAMLGQEE